MSARADGVGAPLTIGVDIGGTCTDVVLHDGERDSWRTAKVLTSATDPAESVLAGIDAVLGGQSLADVGLISHATTLGINAIIERKGARTALITNEGFTDLIEMGSGQRYDIYELFPTYPEPLVEPALRIGVAQRTGAGGETLVPLDPGEVERAADRLAEEGVDAVAICLFHSYADPEAEHAVAAIVRERVPGAATSTSSEVVPEIREQLRLATVVANAYIQPVIAGYLERLGARLREREFSGRLLTMLSAGAMGSVEAARRFPVRILESGPAAGGALAERLAAADSPASLVVFDMGGTTAKVSLVRDGELERAFELEVARVHRYKAGSGITVKAPTLDLFEIGAGGGSIARVNDLGLVSVGPDSAGAEPGPACYGQGGELPTVTDADVALGYVSPRSFLGGELRLDEQAARVAIERHMAAPLGASVDAAAWAIHAAANDAMANAVRVHLAERGLEAADMSLLAIGGAGPVHAQRVAGATGIERVLVPPLPGVGSAAGLLLAPIAFDVSRSQLESLDDVDWTAIAALFRSLEDQARELVEGSGVAPDEVVVTRSAAMQVEGQVHELEVPFGADRELGRDSVRAAFERTYQERFHHPPLARPLRVVTWRLRAAGPPPRRSAPDAGGAGEAQSAERRAYFPEAGGWLDAQVLQRGALATGAVVDGPAMIEEPGSTTVVCPGTAASVLADGMLSLEAVTR